MDGVAELFGVLDPLVRRRPLGNARPPALLFQGAGADPVLRLYRERLITAGRETVPHVVVDGRQGTSPDDDPALFDELADGLGRAMPAGAKGVRGMWGLRLPRYWRVRQVLDVETKARTRAGRRRELRDALYARRGELGAPAGWLDAVVRWLERFEIGSVSAAALATPVVGVSRALFAARLKLARRLRWFGTEVARVTGTRHDFLDSALCLVDGGPQRGNDTLVRQVLARALMLDLQAATRRSLLSPFRRRRGTAFVVHLEHVAPGSAAQRALLAFDSVAGQADSDSDTATVRRHTLLILASLAPGLDVRAVAGPDTPTCDLWSAADRLRPLVERGDRTDSEETPEWTAIAIDVPSTALTEQDRQWLALNRKVDPMPVAGAVAVPVVIWTVLAGVAVVVIGVVWPTGERCPDLDDRAGETVGVGDGTAACSFFGHRASGGQTDVQQAMARVERAIAEENADVLATGDPYSTIVFFAPLTVPDEPERQGENALNQLRGTALAQQRANDRVRGNSNRMLTRVVLANPGDRFGHGVEVARQIAERAGADETMIGVVGIGQSRRASRAAVGLLGEEGLPVVAGPVTGDAMIDSSPHYYQVSPRNMRVARMLVTFSTTTEIVRTAGGDMVVPDGAVIVMDHTDEYSENLARDIRDAFVATGRREVDTISYPVEDPDLPLSDGPTGAPAATRVGSLDDLAHQVCASLDERDVMFFASRSQQFAGMVESMHDDNDCPDTYTVVGGSALTKTVEDPSSPLSDYEGVDLYYAAFASRGHSYNRLTDELLRLYDRAYGDEEVAADVSDAALAYDALDALQRTANYALRNHYPVSADTSAEALGGGQIEFDGASGHIALGNGPLGSERQRVPAGKPVLVLPSPWQRSDSALVCGQFAQGDTDHDTWGPRRRPCPSVD